jgi:glycosyltransferase involved in cell wall biosynthesis
MKILLVHNHYQQKGGEDLVFESETSLLSRHKHQIMKWTKDSQHISEMSRLCVVTQTLWSSLSKQELVSILSDSKFDIVHFHNTFPLVSPSSYYACKEFGIPVVQTLHNYRLLCPSANFFRDGKSCEDCLGKSLLWPSIIHACYHDSRSHTAIVTTMLLIHRLLRTWQEKIDIYIALTDFARRKFSCGGLPEDKIVVKPNFVYPDPGVGHTKENYVLFMGRLSEEKGISTLLRAWQDLEGIKLKIVGNGPMKDEVQEYVNRKKLVGVEVLGRRTREEGIALIQRARLLVFPSECYETFGRVMIEAFACGVPVIASRLGAMEEILEDGRTGLHFNIGEPGDLASKVEWAWIHPEAMVEMGSEARIEYETKYNGERNYQMLIDIYNKAKKILF